MNCHALSLDEYGKQSSVEAWMNNSWKAHRNPHQTQKGKALDCC